MKNPVSLPIGKYGGMFSDKPVFSTFRAEDILPFLASKKQLVISFIKTTLSSVANLKVVPLFVSRKCEV